MCSGDGTEAVCHKSENGAVALTGRAKPRVATKTKTERTAEQQDLQYTNENVMFQTHALPRFNQDKPRRLETT